MQTRVITFTNGVYPEELAKHLTSAGFPSSTTLSEIIAGKVDDVDTEIELECVVDEDDVLDELGDDAILKAAAEITDTGAEAREIEDAIRYVRSGDLSLAGALFARVFEGGNLEAAERALRQ